MKILLVNYGDGAGGAQAAAVNLVNSLNEHGIYARLGVIQKQSTNPYVIELPSCKKRKFFFVRVFNFSVRAVRFVLKKLFPHKNFLAPKFQTTNTVLHSENRHTQIDIDWINNSDFDVVNLHWICGDMISIEDLPRIKKPLVWTMHDSWSACGAEHHPNVLENDNRFQSGYFKNNKPVSTIGKDICRKTWKRKVKAWKNLQVEFIAPSHWEARTLETSSLWFGKKCAVIPNVIDRNVFYPRSRDERAVLRRAFGIPQDKKVIAFGAAYEIENPNSVKGSRYLVEALEILGDRSKVIGNSGDACEKENTYNLSPNPYNLFLLVFGHASSSFQERINLPAFFSGYIASPQILSCLYACADIFVCPSVVENLPYTCMEAASCGVPVTAFATGGIPDVVEHKKTGYLANPFDARDLAEGVMFCLENEESLSAGALEKVAKEFDAHDVVQKYIELYEKTL